MQKLVIDTNVFVSSLIQHGYPYLITTEIFSNRSIQLCISGEIIEEYFEVLNREKFTKFPDFITKAQGLLTNIGKKGTKYSPVIKVSLIKDVETISSLNLLKPATPTFS